MVDQFLLLVVAFPDFFFSVVLEVDPGAGPLRRVVAHLEIILRLVEALRVFDPLLPLQLFVVIGADASQVIVVVRLLRHRPRPLLVVLFEFDRRFQLLGHQLTLELLPGFLHPQIVLVIICILLHDLRVDRRRVLMLSVLRCIFEIDNVLVMLTQVSLHLYTLLPRLPLQLRFIFQICIQLSHLLIPPHLLYLLIDFLLLRDLPQLLSILLLQELLPILCLIQLSLVVLSLLPNNRAPFINMPLPIKRVVALLILI